MVLEPSLVVADGRVFMLDVSLRARIVRLMLSCGKGATSPMCSHAQPLAGVGRSSQSRSIPAGQVVRLAGDIVGSKGVSEPLEQGRAERA